MKVMNLVHFELDGALPTGICCYVRLLAVIRMYVNSTSSSNQKDATMKTSVVTSISDAQP